MHASRLTLEPPRLFQGGFTAIELMVVVSIVAILAALAAPSFTPLIERWRVRTAAEDLTSTLYYARSEAIKRGGDIAIEASSGWGDGWKVTHTRSGVATDLQVSTPPQKVTMTQSTGANTIYADRWGMLSVTSGGASTMTMNFLLQPYGKNSDDINAIRLCVVSGGRIEQKKKGAVC
ncbi:MAG: prepilin-type N-terminal cleavage/methylation domain-containing protein [Alcaligenaceae bacterium]|nr:MAG: prepilin-type N-terminal cleavage/methylation domain-containing protein [Alcaligenaceae bacterium]